MCVKISNYNSWCVPFIQHVIPCFVIEIHFFHIFVLSDTKIATWALFALVHLFLSIFNLPVFFCFKCDLVDNECVKRVVSLDLRILSLAHPGVLDLWQPSFTELLPPRCLLIVQMSPNCSPYFLKTDCSLANDSSPVERGGGPTYASPGELALPVPLQVSWTKAPT